MDLESELEGLRETGGENMTKTFKTVCAQGDVLFRRVAAIPTDAVVVPAAGRKLIIAHSETGHHHVMELDRKRGKPAVEMFSAKDNPLLAWLKVNRQTALEHHRPFDTHEPILFAPGVYEVRRQREYSPEGWRQVAD